MLASGASSALKLTNLALTSAKARENGFRQMSKPLHRPHDGNGDASVYRHVYCGTISERVKAALERRLRPHTTLSAYELAYAIRTSESTIWAILSGNSKSGPSGRVLQKLVEFFGAPFLGEVFGGPNIHVLDPRDTKKAAHIKEIARLQAELEAMG